MANHADTAQAADSGLENVFRVGFWSASGAFAAVAGYDIVQILQIVGALKFPWDAALIYGFSLCIAPPFLLAFLALHYATTGSKRIWSHAAIIFAVMCATYVALNYVAQLATVIPMDLQGRLDEVQILDQRPHSLFWDVDALGYICMGLATLFAALALGKQQGSEVWARRFFLANALVTPLIAFVYFYPSFSTTLLLLGSPWIVTSAGSLLMLAIVFRKRLARVSRSLAGSPA